MANAVDAFQICEFKSSKEYYKTGLNYLLGIKLQLEAKERDLQTRLESPSWKVESFENFVEAAEKTFQVWSQFLKGVMPYYLHKHKEMLESTDATLRRLRDASKELLAKANDLQEGGLKVEVVSQEKVPVKPLPQSSIEKIESVRQRLQG